MNMPPSTLADFVGLALAALICELARRCGVAAHKKRRRRKKRRQLEDDE